MFSSLWLNYFKKPIDEIPEFFNESGSNDLKRYFFETEWYSVYDIIEFIADNGHIEYKESFITDCNLRLEKENSAYRFVNSQIIEISSIEEIKEIETAISKSIPYYGVKQHIETSIRLLSNKRKPDFRNSIKESISAVESLCKNLCKNNNSTLGTALKILESRGKLHSALKSAFSSLYGYTSDANGIRHSLMEESNLTKADARFMLISCSAFVNYIIDTVTDKV